MVPHWMTAVNFLSNKYFGELMKKIIVIMECWQFWCVDDSTGLGLVLNFAMQQKNVKIFEN
jgi:hypothetical protein